MKNLGTLKDFLVTHPSFPSVYPSFESHNLINFYSSSKNSPSPTKRTNEKDSSKELKSRNKSYVEDRVVYVKKKLPNSKSNSPELKYQSQSPKSMKSRQQSTVVNIQVKKSEKSEQDFEYIQLQDKVRNELMLDGYHHLIRTIKTNTRSDEYKINGKYKDSAQLFSRLSARMEKPDLVMQPFKVKHQTGTGKLIHNKNTANIKVLDQTTTSWVGKHGKITDEIHFKSLAKVVFDMLDPEGKGEITGRIFCEFLIDIGFPLDIFTTFSFIKKYRKSDSIDTVKLNYDDLTNFCKADHKTDKLLSAIYYSLGEVSQNTKEKIDIITLYKEVKKWWDEVDRNKCHLVKCNEVCSFLVSKKVSADFNEAYKMVSKCVIDGFVDFAHFQLIFVKGFIKHLLINIQYRFPPGDWEDDSVSGAYKLNHLKKQLILAGISFPLPQISYEEGLTALNAIKKYKNIIKQPVVKMEYAEFCQIWKEMTGELLGKTYMKTESNDPGSKFVESPDIVKNRYTIIGNTDTKRRVKQYWQHSFSPDVKFRQFEAINRDEVRSVKQNKLLKEFCELVKYEGFKNS